MVTALALYQLSDNIVCFLLRKGRVVLLEVVTETSAQCVKLIHIFVQLVVFPGKLVFQLLVLRAQSLYFAL